MAVNHLGAGLRRRWVVLVLQSFGVALLVMVGCIAWLTPDFAIEVATSVLWGDTTEYAPIFREDAFARVHVGMSSDDVLKLLGRPLAIRRAEARGGAGLGVPAQSSERTDAWWSYSRPGGGIDSYEVRALRIGSDGLVLEIARRRYAD